MARKTPSKRQGATILEQSSPPKKATPEKKTPKKGGKENAEVKSTGRKLTFPPEESGSEELQGLQKLQILDRERREEGMQVFQDETAALTASAIENFFMNGKSAAERMNPARIRKGRKARIEPEDDDDEEMEVDEGVDNNFLKCNLTALRDYITTRNNSEKAEAKIDELDEKEFSKWVLYLASGFNLLLHGVGSKRDVLTRFETSELAEMSFMRIDARKEDATPKCVLAAINEGFRLNSNGKGMPIIEWARDIVQKMRKNDYQLILLIDNLEASDWSNQQEVLCALLENRQVVKMVATVDHVYSTFIWNSRQISALNLLHITINTFDMPLEELITGESRILGLDAKSSQSCHTIASLDAFWKSLASNSQKLFKIFFDHWFRRKKAINFYDLFDLAKSAFIASSDAALRTQLVEFKDHRIVKFTRGDDGNDQIAGIVEQKLITEFLEAKGMPLDLEGEKD